MKLYRIQAVILRHIVLTFRDFHRFIDLIYWPLLEIIIWGFTARWMQTYQPTSHVGLLLLSSLIFWQVLLRSQLEISFSFLDELWSHNLINFFSTPIKLIEWVIAVMVLGFIKSLFTFVFGVSSVLLLYSLNIIQPGLIIFIYLFGMIVAGWSIGFLTTAAIAYWGQKIQSLAWIMGWFFAPFSGVFYPVSVLPRWGQIIASFIPMSYLFESLRILLATGVLHKKMLFMGLLISVGYLFFALVFFKYAFEKSKNYGLSRLERYE